jgi:hypothetical protein
MQDLWLAFMRDPVGGLPAPGWYAYVPGGDAIEFAWDGEVMGRIALREFDDNCEGTNPVAGAVPPDHV